MSIPGLRHRHINVAGRSLERHLLRQLSWWNFLYAGSFSSLPEMSFQSAEYPEYSD